MHKKISLPDHVYESDWSDRYQTSDIAPNELMQLINTNNRLATEYVLTGATAQYVSVRGVSSTLATLALYAYWLKCNRTSYFFHYDTLKKDRPL
ncbi:MAG: hypothetical protein CBB68_06135 [Rhodospirillaceae bacterium TMED8]|nr:hypothetical protein [Magnetovibrio sp.]OUT51201.1 MAG: hypothetical protein CBB68_06135 [Rhodospirillaceae bacterium TMED8]